MMRLVRIQAPTPAQSKNKRVKKIVLECKTVTLQPELNESILNQVPGHILHARTPQFCLSVSIIDWNGIDIVSHVTVNDAFVADQRFQVATKQTKTKAQKKNDK